MLKKVKCNGKWIPLSKAGPIDDVKLTTHGTETRVDVLLHWLSKLEKAGLTPKQAWKFTAKELRRGLTLLEEPEFFPLQNKYSLFEMYKKDGGEEDTVDNFLLSIAYDGIIYFLPYGVLFLS